MISHLRLARAVPYGIYDVNRQQGSVYVGVSADTPEFAVAAIARRWEGEGRSISLNWAGKPLRTLETILNFIRGTATSTGLTVRAVLLEGYLRKGKPFPIYTRESRLMLS